MVYFHSITCYMSSGIYTPTSMQEFVLWKQKSIVLLYQVQASSTGQPVHLRFFSAGGGCS